MKPACRERTYCRKMKHSEVVSRRMALEDICHQRRAGQLTYQKKPAKLESCTTGGPTSVVTRSAPAHFRLGEATDLTGIYRTFHPKTKDYSQHFVVRSFFKTDHTIGHKTGLSRYKIRIIPCILSDTMD